MARATDAKLFARLLNRLWPKHMLQKYGEEHVVPCPFCASENPKCWVNPDKGVFQCWVCGEKGPTAKFLFHLRDLSHIRQSDVNAIMGGGAKGLSSAIEALQEQDTRKKEHKTDHAWSVDVPCVYPPGAVPLQTVSKDGSFESKMRESAIKYLAKRGFDEDDIDRYRIHFVVDILSRYHGHLLFPILDRDGRQLKYWTTRSIFPGAKPKSLHANGKYTRFSAQHTLMYEDRILKGNPVALCEGPFDALSVNKHVMPAVALLGKILHPYHIETLKVTQPSEAVMCLDPEAVGDADKIAKRLRGLGIPTRVLKLQDGDPNDIPPDSLKAQFAAAMCTPLEEPAWIPRLLR